MTRRWRRLRPGKWLYKGGHPPRTRTRTRTVIVHRDTLVRELLVDAVRKFGVLGQRAMAATADAPGSQVAAALRDAVTAQGEHANLLKKQHALMKEARTMESSVRNAQRAADRARKAAERAEAKALPPAERLAKVRRKVVAALRAMCAPEKTRVRLEVTRGRVGGRIVSTFFRSLSSRDIQDRIQRAVDAALTKGEAKRVSIIVADTPEGVAMRANT